MAQPSEGAFDQAGQLICSAVNGLVQGRCMVDDRDRLLAFEAGFYHAAYIVIAALLGTVLIAQVDFDLRNMIAKSAQGILHNASHLSGQRLVPIDIMVGIDLDLHGILLFAVWLVIVSAYSLLSIVDPCWENYRRNTEFGVGFRLTLLSSFA
jgi:hypothetical protein